MLFRQILHEDLSCASYLVGDTGSGVAAVIDPQGSIEPYLRLSRLHGVEIEALHTPGHRPEHTSFLLRDADRGGDPWAVLTGDSLFVGDVARPDLAIEKREGAADIYRSLQKRLMSLPDEVEVWPGHLGGSLCGSAGIDEKTSSTIGFERRHNRALSFDSEEAFVEDAVATLGRRPPNVEKIVALNRGQLVETLGA